MTRSARPLLTALAAVAAAVLVTAGSAGVAHADGTEHIGNGNFDSGVGGWWATPAAPISAVDGRLCADVSADTTNIWDAGVGVNGVALVKGDTYTVTFTASTDVPATVRTNVQLSSDPYTPTSSRDLALTSTPKTFSYSFISTMTAEGTLTFQLGTGSAYRFCVDDVSVTSAPTAEAPDGAEHVRNGFFDSGTAEWFAYGTSSSGVTDGRMCGTATTGLTNLWDAGIGQNGIELVEGTNYTLSFDASVTPGATVRAAVQLGQDPYTSYFQSNEALTPETTSYRYTFTAPETTSVGQLAFQFGGSSSDVTFCLGNVSLRGGS